MVFDRPFYSAFIKLQTEHQIQENDIEVVYSFCLSHFRPTLELVDAVRGAVNAGCASPRLYQEATSGFAEWYNDKYDKDIDSSYVENKLRAREAKLEDKDSLLQDGKETGRKNHLELGRLNRYEGAKQAG